MSYTECTINFIEYKSSQQLLVLDINHRVTCNYLCLFRLLVEICNALHFSQQSSKSIISTRIINYYGNNNKDKLYNRIIILII